MAIQKKLILENGEVRSVAKSRSRPKQIKPLRKRMTVNLNNPRELGNTSANVTPSTAENKAVVVKKIVNRKDKLLAEHRSRQTAPTSTPESASTVLPTQPMAPQSPPAEPAATETIKLEELVIVIELTCPFCDYVCMQKKDYYKHIKVTFHNCLRIVA